MTHTRRSILSALGLALPAGFGACARASATPTGPAPVLRFRSFEDAVREAFADLGRISPGLGGDHTPPGRRVEIGHSELVRGGLQGCHNDRPFAGFPAGHLRVVRAGSEPGPVWQGVRLYVSSVDVVLTGGPTPGVLARPLNFASLPPAPIFS